MLSRILAEDDEINVVGTAIDPVFALQKIMREPPDVITLDVEMPRMDGLTFLRKLMESYPLPVVMISSRTQKGCETALKALELGAVDFITKPDRNVHDNLAVLKSEIISKVKNAAHVDLKMSGKILNKGAAGETDAGWRERDNTARRSATRKLVALGASTGGVVAVRRVIDKLKPGPYSILVILHMPPGFTKSFAAQLGSVNGWHSCEAGDGQPLVPGNIYVAPGGHNMTLQQRNGAHFIRVRPCEATDIFKPNVNKTFASVAQNAGLEAVGVIMTGMGDDGANGLLMMRKAGAATIAQSEETCMVYGMPKRAVEVGAVEYIVPLDQIAAKVMQLV